MTSTQSSAASPTPELSAAGATLRDRINARTASIGIVGLGYVGLPLARAVHEAGFSVVGFDIDPTKTDALNRGECYMEHLGSAFAETMSTSDRFRATSDPADLADADAILLCVPTPLGSHNEPDLSFVLESTREVAKILRPGHLVVLESTTYPGTTRQEMLPILEGSGLTHGVDFFLAYSPEREDPGRKGESTATIPKLVGGIDGASGDLAFALYDAIVASAHRVSSAEIAESAKLLENIYRAVNIAMVNELKVILDRLGIDVWEVIAAAATKPFGFQPFYPGPGLGGHCIPIDPFYLTWKAREAGLPTRFIELAGEINQRMPGIVVDRVGSALNADGKAMKGASVLVLGVAYKPNIDDARETPAAEIIEQLVAAGAAVSYHDPHIADFPHMRKHDIHLSSVELSADALQESDAVVIVTDHAAIDWDLVATEATLVIDTRDALGAFKNPRARVVKA